MVSLSLSFIAHHFRQQLAALSQNSASIYTQLQHRLAVSVANASSKDPKQRHATDRSSAVNQEQTSSVVQQESRLHLKGMEMPLRPNYVAPRLPIVLCHGLFGFDKMGPDFIPQLQIHYWSGIHEALVKLGAKVIVTRVPRAGGIVERARELHRILEATMEGRDVNLLAHSMGGLDCRYLVSHMPSRTYDVRTLTTISTPHRGSPVMDWFRDHIGVGVVASLAEAANKASQVASGDTLRESYTASAELEHGKETIRRIYDGSPRYRKDGSLESLESLEKEDKSTDKDKVTKVTTPSQSDSSNSSSRTTFSLPFTIPSIPLASLNPTALLDPLLSRVVQSLDTPAYSNLTTDYCVNHFNPNTPDANSVNYYSYGAAAQIPNWSPLIWSWDVINGKEGPNDGLVSVKSAKWGRYIETAEADHWDLNGRWPAKLSGRSKFDTIDFYLRVATFLHSEGF